MTRVAARAAVTVASVYGFFLLFAQFAFVELIRGAGHGVVAERFLLAAMAVAGVAAGFLAAWRGVRPAMIRIAMGVAAAAAVIASLGGSLTILIFVSLTTGAALGAATVSLAAMLPGWCGMGAVAVGTGVGYAVCNLPWVFPQSPVHQAWIAAGIAGIGALAVPPVGAWRKTKVHRPLAFPWVVLLFTALVWMDSAAFFIIQHEADLKSATWGNALLWRNAALHLGFALLAGLWLKRGVARRALPVAAWVLLAVAALWVNDAPTRWAAGWLYPSAVSMYSVALVVWPGWFCGAKDSRSAAWKAAWLFAAAGWFGSANGIGMADTLRHVPTAFIVVSALVVMMALGSDRRVFRPAMVAGTVFLCGWIMGKPAEKPRGSAVERGRQVYISEGCIHCHSQYSRPGSVDERIWGSSPDKEMTLRQQPVLIGNRRQGPDLTNIAARRSAPWLKAHFIDPRALSPDSTMPSYAHLFKDLRGDDLVTYLQQCGIQTLPDLLARQASWVPDQTSPSAQTDGKRLFARHCAVCHGSDGAGDGPLKDRIPLAPTNLRKGPFLRTADGRKDTIARIIRFGVIGSHMPGHETMGDAEVLELVDHIRDLRKPK